MNKISVSTDDKKKSIWLNRFGNWDSQNMIEFLLGRP
jgi:hypothetical protein